MFQTDIVIANAIQTKLNTLATGLYAAETVDRRVVFKVASNYDDYHKLTEMEFTVGTDIRYTPCLLQKTGSVMQDDFDSGFYSDSYSLVVYGFQDDKTSIEYILEKYVYDESSTDRENMAGYVVKKQTSRPQFISLHADGSGDNRKRVVYQINFTWDYVLGGIISDDVTITINGSPVKHVQLGFTSDKISIGNVAYGNNTKPIGATGFTLDLTLPIQVGNTIHTTLLTDVMNKSFNKSYAISVAFSSVYTFSTNVTLKRGSLNYVRDQLITFTCVFEEALPRTVVTVDSVVVPVISFNMSYDVQKGDALTTSADINTRFAPGAVTQTWRIKFGYDPTQAKNQELLRAILDSSYYDNTYTLGVTVNGITAKTYSVMLANGNYSFEQTGELMYECVFVRKAVI